MWGTKAEFQLFMSPVASCGEMGTLQPFLGTKGSILVGAKFGALHGLMGTLQCCDEQRPNSRSSCPLALYCGEMGTLQRCEGC